MQIREIIIFSRDGRKRAITLNVGKVNVLTGRSNTGKSALIYITSYCLGGDNCMIPDGRILEAVSWFGLLLDIGKERLFVARENLYPHQNSTNRMFVERGAGIESPATAPPGPNTTAEAAEELLTRILQISPNLNVPPLGQTRSPLSANIRHSLFYCFQHQTEIETNQILFHRQHEDHITQTIKDTLPYFLGAVREDHLVMLQELALQKRELKLLEQRHREAESVRGDEMTRARSLQAEAIEIGILPAEVPSETLINIRENLQRVLEWEPTQPTFGGSDIMTQLQEEVTALEARRQKLSDDVKTAKAFAREADGFTTEAQVQTARLESIGLFETSNHDPATCPLCQNHLETPTPTSEAIKHSLDALVTDLATVTREQPRLREYIDKLETELAGVLRQKDEKQEAVKRLVEQDEGAKRLRDVNVRRGIVVGRVGLWLQSVPETRPDSTLSIRIAQLKTRVQELEALTTTDDAEERLASILNRISVQMTEWARRLKLEFSDNPVRLDLSAATVVIDRPERQVPLKRLGAGRNWVGYHLVAYLALHKHFRERDRPVPGFLFLDQPTQAFFPPDRDAEMQGKEEALPQDDDRRQVAAMFDLIFDCVQQLAPKLQVIVTDHADLNNPRFKAAVVERWREPDKALVPQDWPSI